MGAPIGAAAAGGGLGAALSGSFPSAAWRRGSKTSAMISAPASASSSHDPARSDRCQVRAPCTVSSVSCHGPPACGAVTTPRASTWLGRLRPKPARVPVRATRCRSGSPAGPATSATRWRRSLLEPVPRAARTAARSRPRNRSRAGRCCAVEQRTRIEAIAQRHGVSIEIWAKLETRGWSPAAVPESRSSA